MSLSPQLTFLVNTYTLATGSNYTGYICSFKEIFLYYIFLTFYGTIQNHLMLSYSLFVITNILLMTVIKEHPRVYKNVTHETKPNVILRSTHYLLS